GTVAPKLRGSLFLELRTPNKEQSKFDIYFDCSNARMFNIHYSFLPYSELLFFLLRLTTHRPFGSPLRGSSRKVFARHFPFSPLHTLSPSAFLQEKQKPPMAVLVRGERRSSRTLFIFSIKLDKR
ncbi:MAG: hypothetical protein KAT14_07585, partial [Candidatus Marinimicrobia bacterium]|nr:hypothetical protein [Candidatus Neomarinimicrobiota bacterium]